MTWADGFLQAGWSFVCGAVGYVFGRFSRSRS